jgi:hypothetical protein
MPVLLLEQTTFYYPSKSFKPCHCRRKAMVKGNFLLVLEEIKKEKVN